MQVEATLIKKEENLKEISKKLEFKHAEISFDIEMAKIKTEISEKNSVDQATFNNLGIKLNEIELLKKHKKLENKDKSLNDKAIIVSQLLREFMDLASENTHSIINVRDDTNKLIDDSLLKKLDQQLLAFEMPHFKEMKIQKSNENIGDSESKEKQLKPGQKIQEIEIED